MNASTEHVVARKIQRINNLMNSSRLRESIFGYLYSQAVLSIARADIGVVLGTSPKKYPEKFEARIRHASKLLRDGNIVKIVFTGRSDNETLDDNQAHWAAHLAESMLGLNPEDYILVGGDNTQENLEEAAVGISSRFPWARLAYAISENHHLIRTVSQARPIFRTEGLDIYGSPVNGVQKLDANDPESIRELVKAVAYNGILFRTRIPTADLPEARAVIDAQIKSCESALFPTVV